MMRLSILCGIVFLWTASLRAGDPVLIPQIDGQWWQVAGDPDLGQYTSEKQQPVDFGIWQAADGSWQIWSCIRHTRCGGKTRLFCRTSHDLSQWSEPVMVSGGGSPAKQDHWFGGDAECPFVLERDAVFYLFRNQRYGQDNLNTQYRSKDPLNFGVDHDRYLISTLPVAAPEILFHDGSYFIASLMPSLKGIRIARLKWVESKQPG